MKKLRMTNLNSRNKLLKFILPIFVLLGLVLTLTSGCTRNLNKVEEGEGKLIVGLDETFVPMGFRDKDGQLKGFDIDLAKAVAKKLNREIVFQPIDWAMKETELKNGTIDLIWNGYSVTPDRKKEVAFSNSYLTNSQDLIVLTDGADSSKKLPLSYLDNKVIGMQNSSSGQLVFDNFPKVLKDKVKTPVLYDNFNNAFMDLNAKRISGILGDSIYLDYYRSKQKNPAQYQIIQADYPKETFAVGLRKNNPKLLKQLNKALKELKEDGTAAKLSKKWFNRDLSI